MGKIIGYMWAIIAVVCVQMICNYMNRLPKKPKNGAIILQKQPPTIQQLLDEQEAIHGLPKGLLRAVASVESANNPNAINAKTHDYGLLQINVKNLQKHGLTGEQAMEVRVNAALGAKIMRDMKRRFGHTSGWECRYNVGTGKLMAPKLAETGDKKTQKRSTLCANYLRKLKLAGYNYEK